MGLELACGADFLVQPALRGEPGTIPGPARPADRAGFENFRFLVEFVSPSSARLRLLTSHPSHPDTVTIASLPGLKRDYPAW